MTVYLLTILHNNIESHYLRWNEREATKLAYGYVCEHWDSVFEDSSMPASMNVAIREFRLHACAVIDIEELSLPEKE